VLFRSGNMQGGTCWHLHSESSKACSTDIYVGRSVWSPRMAMNTLEQETKGDAHTVVQAGLSPEKKKNLVSFGHPEELQTHEEVTAVTTAHTITVRLSILDSFKSVLCLLREWYIIILLPVTQCRLCVLIQLSDCSLQMITRWCSYSKKRKYII
jgi:hypothetical protein